MLKKIKKYVIKKIFNRHINEKEINYKTVQEMLKKENTVLIDVRSHQEYEEGHLIGAILIPLYTIKDEILKVEPNKKTNIIVYCTSGVRSKEAMEILEMLGYENVYSLKGGLNAI